MGFVVRSDYKNIIKDDALNVIISNDNTRLARAELQAQSEMESYLRTRYKIAEVFINVAQYSAATTYNPDDHVVYQGKIYYALQASTGNAPTDASYWTLGDLRSPVILMYLVDMALYHLHSSVSPQMIPELRMDRYDQAIDWLKRVMRGDIDPGLPKLDDSAGELIRYGSNTKRNLSY